MFYSSGLLGNEEAVKEKLEQLRKVKEGILSSQELANLITQRRMAWIDKNLSEMLVKYNGLSPEEKAHRIVFLEHMGINPAHSEIERISPNKIRIKSHNFCPYLEACKQLGLETESVCREIGEPSLQEMLKRINPNLKFSRNYKNIRPRSHFCEEFVEILR